MQHVHHFHTGYYEINDILIRLWYLRKSSLVSYLDRFDSLTSFQVLESDP